MTEQFKVATVRALYGGIITGMSVGLSTLAATGDYDPSALAGLIAFFSYLMARGVAEGFIDSKT